MNSTLRPFLFAILAFATALTALGAEEKMLDNEALGKLKLGQKVADVTALIGKADSKGKDT